MGPEKLGGGLLPGGAGALLLEREAERVARRVQVRLDLRSRAPGGIRNLKFKRRWD